MSPWFEVVGLVACTAAAFLVRPQPGPRGGSAVAFAVARWSLALFLGGVAGRLAYRALEGTGYVAGLIAAVGAALDSLPVPDVVLGAAGALTVLGTVVYLFVEVAGRRRLYASDTVPTPSAAAEARMANDALGALTGVPGVWVLSFGPDRTGTIRWVRSSGDGVTIGAPARPDFADWGADALRAHDACVRHGIASTYTGSRDGRHVQVWLRPGTRIGEGHAIVLDRTDEVAQVRALERRANENEAAYTARVTGRLRGRLQQVSASSPRVRSEGAPD